MPLPLSGAMSTISLHDLTFAETEQRLADDGLARHHARARHVEVVDGDDVEEVEVVFEACV